MCAMKRFAPDTSTSLTKRWDGERDEWGIIGDTHLLARRGADGYISPFCYTYTKNNARTFFQMARVA